MYAPLAISRETEIEAAVAEVERELKPDVVRIRYEIGHDWSDEWAIFFRIVLTDEAARNRRGELMTQVQRELARRLDFRALGVWSYHNYRTESEQARRREEAWA
jgi:hypothetical protein